MALITHDGVRLGSMYLESPDLYERVTDAWCMFCNGDINKMEYEIIENMAFREDSERRSSRDI